MLETRQQWQTTIRQIQRFRDAIDVLTSVELPAGVDPEIRKIEEDAMRSVLADLEEERLEYEARNKRFFRCFDKVGDGDDDYAIVAFDLDDAKRMIRESGIEFCNPYDDAINNSVPFDRATWLTWTELLPGEAEALRINTTDDGRGRGVIPLSHADVGEWFGQEW